MNNKSDFNTTHEKILSGLIVIAQNKPIYQVSVAELTRQININRGTFYLHFTDISEAILRIENDLIEKILIVLKTTRLLHTGNSFELNMYIAITDSIQENWNKYVTLLGINGDFQFSNRLKSKLIPYIGINGIKKTHKNKNIPIDMAEDIIMNSIFNIVLFWITQRPELNGEQIANTLYQTRRMNPLEIGGIL